MKNRMNVKNTGRRAPLWALVLLLVSSFFISCVVEPAAKPDAPSGTEQTVVMLNINTPGTTLPVATRSQTTEETHISQVRVLVFEKSAGDYIFSYHVTGTNVTSNGTQTQFKAMLAGMDVPLKLMVLANTTNVFGAGAPSPGDTEDKVRAMLNEAFTPNGLQGDLPMYGELELPEGINPTETYSLPVTVLRAISRVDVVKELIAGAPDFILEEAYAFRANNTIQLIPGPLENPASPKVTAPSVPDAAAPLESPLMEKVPGGAESILRLYLPESARAVTNTEKIKQATTIVIGGRFGGPESPVTYYRADFNSGIEGHPFGQILRNHRYIFKIKSVSGHGWPTPGEAADNLSSSIAVDVQTWEDFSSEIYMGDDRFGISSREISLRYTKDRERRLDVESSLRYQIQWLSGGVPAGNATSDYETVISNDNFDAWIIAGNDGDEYLSRIAFRTRNNNHLGDIITETLRITAGRWKIDVTVRQDNSAMYSNRYMNILTANDVGNLGQDLVASDASGLAMRKILDVQFAPDGVIRIGGSSFTRISNTTGYVGTSEAANLAVMKRIIGSQDVIYFPYNTAISSSVADLLLEWIEADTRRVLIIGTDSDSSNKALRDKAKVAADGTWAFSNAVTIAPTFLRAPHSAEAEDFFNGPFGTVAENASFKRIDATAGYLSARSTAVTPLIMANNTSYSDHMFFGVNKANRIIYHGDANLFMTSQMSNNTGAVNSDLDRLMANMWAWIVEQVIYGAEE